MTLQNILRYALMTYKNSYITDTYMTKEVIKTCTGKI